ncbi:MAG: hypothetical protein HY062_02095 [Bacteroidetes bacterium]|nr:hypothetical protein [Bacteroidota bacterium]
MKIERLITVFEKKEGGKFFREINVDVINLDLLKKLFKHFDDDPDYYRPYQIEQRQYNELIKYVNEMELYPPTEYYIFIEAVQAN